MRLARLAALVVLLVPLQAWAFDWFGLKSGMTVDQVRAAAPAGSTLRVNGDFGYVEKGGQAIATVAFCKGRLIALSRTIDAQSDWFALADRMIKRYGRPTVTPASDPWAGPAASVRKGLELSWRSGRNKYALTAYPSAQPSGPGKAQANLSVADLGPVNACIPRRAAVHAHLRKAGFVRHARRTKRLPPIGGARLRLLPAEVEQAQAEALAPRRPVAASRKSARRGDVPAQAAPPIDPASVRGRILRFFGLVKAPPGADASVQSE